MLQIDGLSAPGLSRVTARLETGLVTGLHGPRGSGKTSLLRSICGFQAPTEGRIILSEVGNLIEMSPLEISLAGVVFVDAPSGIFPALDVRDNLRLGAWHSHTDRKHFDRATDQIVSLFPILGRDWTRPAGLLPRGERRLLAVAMSFYMSPKVMCIDDLTLGLDRDSAGVLVDVVRAVAAAETTVVVVEHSAAMTAAMCDRVIVLDAGSIKDSGTPQEVFSR